MFLINTDKPVNLRYHVITAAGNAANPSTLNFDPKYLITGVNKIENLTCFLLMIETRLEESMLMKTMPFATVGTGVDQIEEEDISVVLKPPGFEDVVATGDTPLTVPLISTHKCSRVEKII